MSEASTALALLTIDKFEKGVDDSITDTIPELWWFKDRGKLHTNQHGIGRQWLARVDRGEVIGFARETRVSPVRKNRDIRARLTNRGYAIGEMLHQTDIWENGTPEELMDLMKDMMEGMESDMIDAQGGGFYDDGTDPTYQGLGWQGMDAAIINTGSYADISADDVPNFFSSVPVAGGNVVLDPTGLIFATYTVDPLPVLSEIVTRGRYGGKMGKGRKKPDIGFMSHELFNIAHNTLVRAGTMALNNKVVNAGDFEHFVYRGVTWFPSDYVPAGFIYCLNSEWIDFNFPSPKVVNQYKEQSGVPYAIYVLLVSYGLLRVKLPRTCGRYAVA